MNKIAITLLSAILMAGCNQECATRSDEPRAQKPAPVSSTFTQQGSRRIYPANYVDPNFNEAEFRKTIKPGSPLPRRISLEEFNHPTEPVGPNIPRRNQ